MPKSQSFILDRMQICGHILCERSFSAMLICWKKARLAISKKTEISSSIEPNKSLKMGKFSLAQASVNGNLLLMYWISLDYFCHHQGFVFTHADNNLFITQLIMHEINPSWHHVFMLLCGTLNTIKLIWEVEMHVGENFFQFNYQ